MAYNRRWFQNPYYQVCQIPIEHLNNTERHPLLNINVPPEVCTEIGDWYFGNGALSPKHQYPLRRFGPYKSYKLALAAAQAYYAIQ